MKLALLSDIHANIQALEACLDDARARGADRVALLGDLVGYGGDPGTVVQLVQDLHADGAVVIKGNHTLAAAEARGAFWADPAHRVGRRKPLVAASVGPYGAMLANGSEYTGHYGLDEAALMDAAIEAGADDVATNDDGSIEVITAPTEFIAVKDALEAAGQTPAAAHSTATPTAPRSIPRITSPAARCAPIGPGWTSRSPASGRRRSSAR